MAALFGSSVKSNSNRWLWEVVTTPVIPLVNGTASHCNQHTAIKYVLDLSALATAATLVLLLNLFQLQRKWKCSLSSLFHVAIPVDFFSATCHRFIYCIILSSWTADVFNDSLNSDLYYRSDDELMDAFLYFVVSPSVIILRQALLYFPVLACVESSFPALGHCLGLFYTLLIGARSIFAESLVIRGCSYRGQLITRDIGVSVGIVLPAYLAYLLVAVWFFVHTILEATLLLLDRRYLRRKHGRDACYSNYVRNLLKKKQPLKLFSSKVELYQNCVRGLAYVLPWKSNPHVYIPLPFLAAISMAFTSIYQVCVLLVSRELIAMGNAMHFVNSFNITVEILDKLLPSQKHKFEVFFYDAKSFVFAMQVVFPMAHWTGLIMTVFFTLYMIQNFHKHLLRAVRGDISFLLVSEPLPSPAYRLAAAMSYIPFQVGHIIFSFMVFSLFQLLLGLVGLVSYYAFKNYTYYAVHFSSLFMVTSLWSFVMHTLQLFLSQYVFLKKTGSNCGNGTLVGIRFRRLYLLCTYLFLFFDVVYSVTMCFLRLLGSMVFNIAMLFRLDRDIYMRGLEGWDLGNRTYVGYFYLEYTTNNAVLRTFLNLLQANHGRGQSYRNRLAQLVKDKPTASVYSIQSGLSSPTASVYNIETSCCIKSKKVSLLAVEGSVSINDCEDSSRMVCSRRARNRWYVAYTLLHNPGIQHLTASRLKQSKHLIL